MQRLRQHINANLFLILTVLGCAFILFGVPQVTNLWLPQRTLTNHWSAWFAVAVSVLGYLYLTTLYRFVRPNSSWWILMPAAMINGSLGKLTKELVPGTTHKRVLAWPILFAAVGSFCLFLVPIDVSTPYVEVGCLIRMFGLWLLLVSLWLLCGYWFGPAALVVDVPVVSRLPLRFSQADAAPPNVETRSGVKGPAAWQACGEVLSWMACMGLICEVFWVTAAFEMPGASFRLYSVAALFFLVIFWCVCAALLDFLQKILTWPIRMGFVLLSLLAIFFTSGDDVQDPMFATPPPAATDDSWMDAFEQRLNETRGGPVIVVAASGGGSRAALFTSLVLHLLSQEPMTVPEARPPIHVDGSEIPPITKRTWGDQIVLISSVSGGSLATARFVGTQQFPATDCVPYGQDLRYSTREELEEQIKSQLNEQREIKSLSGEEQERLKSILAAFEQQTVDAEPTPAQKAVRIGLYSRFADDMCMDFMAPILRGFLTPRAARGEGLYHFWNDQFRWKGASQSSSLAIARHVPEAFAETHDGEGDLVTRSSPMALINTTDADAGRRVIVGFPPVPAGFLVGTARNKNSGTEAASRGADYMAVSEDDFAASPLELSLSRAVRLSSNFPFGFRVCRLSSSSHPKLSMHPNAPQVRGYANRGVLRLLDGGVVDNTGIDSIHAVFEALRVKAEQDPLGRAAEILAEVRRRGVIFVEIDAGAKPSGGQDNSSPMSLLTRPLAALNNAIYTNALRTSDEQLTEIRSNLTDSIDAGILADAVQQAIQSKQIDASLATESWPIASDFPDLHLNRITAQNLVPALCALLSRDYASDSAQSVMTFRFSCNHISDTSGDVMTAFALGPKDKARVIGSFLTEAVRWSEDRDDTIKAHRGNIDEDEPVTTEFEEQDRKAVAGQLLRQVQDRITKIRKKMEAASDPKSLKDDVETSDALDSIYTLLLGVRVLKPDINLIGVKTGLLAKIELIENEIGESENAAVASDVVPQSTLENTIKELKDELTKQIRSLPAEKSSKLTQEIRKRGRDTKMLYDSENAKYRSRMNSIEFYEAQK